MKRSAIDEYQGAASANLARLLAIRASQGECRG